MKNRLLFLGSLITIVNCIHAQRIIEPEWVKQVSSIEEGSAQSWDVDVDADGMIYWPVSIDSLDNGVNIYAYKFNQAGDEMWDHPSKLGGIGGQFAFAVNGKHDDVYVGGRECLFTGFSCDMQLWKLDKVTGDLEWERTQDFGNNGYDEVDGIVVEDDAIYIGGWAQAIQEGPYQIDMGFWKLDLDGNTIWTNYFGEENTAEHQDGHIVVDDNYIFAGGLYGGTGITNLYNGHSIIAKFSKEDGSFVDSTLFGPQSNAFLDIENVLGMTSDGEYFYLTGYTTPVNTSHWETFIAKVDKELNVIWLKNWGGSGTETARGITVHDGLIYVAGLTESQEFVTGGAGDALLLIFDTDGNYVSHHTWGGEMDDSFRDVAYYSGALYLSGTSGRGSATEGNVSGNLIKVDLDMLTSIEEYKSKNTSTLKIFPNPTDNFIQIKFSQRAEANLDLSCRVRRMDGSLISSIENAHLHVVNDKLISISRELNNGLYLIEITTNKGVISKTFVMAK